MANMDGPMPGWINKWLIINSLILIMDGGFCVLRPHSLPGGSLSTVYYPYKWYIEADKHYADPTDSFVFTQGFGNLVEAVIGLLIVMNIFKTARLTKLVTMFVSVMTAYKTFLFFMYSLDIGQGGRAMQDLWSEFLVFGLGAVWLIVPLYVIWVVIQDFLPTKRNYNATRSSSSSPAALATSRMMNMSYDVDYVDSGRNSERIKTPAQVTKHTTTTTIKSTHAQNSASTQKTKSAPSPRTTPSRRYNLRER